MSQSPIIFDEIGFERQGENNGVLIWFTPKGDGLGLFHYPIPRTSTPICLILTVFAPSTAEE